VEESGFTLIELVVTLTIIAIVFTSGAYVMYSGLKAYSAARQRSVFIEIANGELEAMRSIPYDDAGVASSDPNLSSAYNDPTSGKFEGRNAVILSSGSPLPAVTTVTSSDIDGVVVPYTVRRWVTWVGKDGGTAQDLKRLALQVEWTESSGATRSYRLTSTRYPGGQGPATVTGNSAPVAVLSGSPTSGNLNLTVAFDASMTLDADGDTISYDFDFGDGFSVTGSASPLVSHTYTVGGNYVARVTATDTNGASSSATQPIQVLDPSGSAPVAVATNTPTSGVAPLVVSFSAAGSSDPDNDIASYSWNFGDGNTGSGVTVNHTYANAGTFVATLTVTDAGGRSSTATVSTTTTPLTCSVTSGQFTNNGLVNRVVVASSNRKPNERTFTFAAQTNTACTSLTGRITIDGGEFEVPLLLQSTAGGVKQWSGTGSVAANDSLPTGCNQTGTFIATAGAATTYPLSFSYKVYTSAAPCA